MVFTISLFMISAIAIEMYDLLNVLQDLSRPLLAKAVQGLQLVDPFFVCVIACVFLISETYRNLDLL